MFAPFLPRVALQNTLLADTGRQEAGQLKGTITLLLELGCLGSNASFTFAAG